MLRSLRRRHQTKVSIATFVSVAASAKVDLEIRSTCLLVKDVRYVNFGKEVKRGILVIKLVLAGDPTGRPGTHEAYFSSDHRPRRKPVKHRSGALNGR